jgi:hypothetical protein
MGSGEKEGEIVVSDEPTLKYAKTIILFVRDLDRLYSTPNTSRELINSCIEHLYTKLYPYTDERFRKESESLLKETKEARNSPRQAYRKAATFEYYRRLEMLLVCLMQRLGLGLEEESSEII